MSQNEITRKIKTWQQPSKQTVRAGMEVIPMKSNRLTMDLGNLKLDESTLERVRNAAVKAAMQEAQKSIGTAQPKADWEDDFSTFSTFSTFSSATAVSLNAIT